ncbi:uncharacterized protein MELLADRAFT_112395 [Melampsora larici-populina 98AG31]|uniref:Uncharacterized protein n=1 Tax=Melampsora larici-populina (strain 98AG31 / pathotype 3-4-7) TaxID=747676 RepID=F4S6C3_MELLP|nr:uncharacterized protein MELLADRAFT_112395 [Melampsora larici-populina 98AG31]EGF99786.1 hypothetical protein MELLADRAFT_112395 [Melampsora larici-populina 98AG31]
MSAPPDSALKAQSCFYCWLEFFKVSVLFSINSCISSSTAMVWTVGLTLVVEAVGSNKLGSTLWRKTPHNIWSTLLILASILLRLPQESREGCDPSLVDASKAIGESHKLFPNLFGHKGPYGQLHVVNNVVYSLGMTMEPSISGEVANQINYENSIAVVSLLCSV